MSYSLWDQDKAIVGFDVWQETVRVMPNCPSTLLTSSPASSEELYFQQFSHGGVRGEVF